MKNLIWLVCVQHAHSFLPRFVLSLLQQECLIFRAQGLLPGIEIILESPHRHLAAPWSGAVHDEAALAGQGAQHPGAQRQQRHREEAHGASHGECRVLQEEEQAPLLCAGAKIGPSNWKSSQNIPTMGWWLMLARAGGALVGSNRYLMVIEITWQLTLIHFPSQISSPPPTSKV